MSFSAFILSLVCPHILPCSSVVLLVVFPPYPVLHLRVTPPSAFPHRVMQKKRSAVWRHFAEEGENKVSCRTCHKRLTKHGNTSMMLRHLRGKHPELMHCLLLDAEGPSSHADTWNMDEPQAEEAVESLPPIDASGTWLSGFKAAWYFITCTRPSHCFLIYSRTNVGLGMFV